VIYVLVAKVSGLQVQTVQTVCTATVVSRRQVKTV
jgi:hypothetical protein